MARGFCVDCNYQGPLAPTGECSRCGSGWTTACVAVDPDDWESMYDDVPGEPRVDHAMDLSASDLDVYSL